MRQEPAFRHRLLPSTLFAVIVRALVVVGVLSSAAACSSSTPSTSGTATGTAAGTGASAAYCDDIQALRGNVDQLQSLKSSNPSASEVKAVLTDAQNNLTKAAQDATGTASIKISAIKTAFSALTAAFSALPTTLTATQAFQQVQPEITALTTAVKAAGAGSGCPSGTASP